jgi:1-pyrroline-5-carboxylate dehydrogenase
MSNAIFRVPPPYNETIRSYAPGSPERKSLQAKLKQMSGERIELPLVIGGKRISTGDTGEITMPHDHRHVLGTYHKATAEHVEQAVEAARAAQPAWAAMNWEDRVAIFLRAADLLAGPYRDVLNGATMLGQSKTAHQAEIDSACELIDFWRYNCSFVERIYHEQPGSPPGQWNRLEHRPLEGFVFAVTPFNFTAIAGNLPTAPAMLGNVCLWKPASSALFSAYYIMEILEKAGLPPGVINLLPGSGGAVGNPAVANRHLAGLHFTGSTDVFNGMWSSIGQNIGNYRTYPRIVGETGGKDFVLAHPSADVTPLAVALVRGAFEYQGQKCSAASRAYIPSNLWPQVREQMNDMINKIKVGHVSDFSNFMGAVIDRGAFKRLSGAIDEARAGSGYEVVIGGKYSDETGYFVHPTVVRSDDPKSKLMREELFGPILTVHVYPENDFEGALQLVDTATDYALTGAVFADDRSAIARATYALSQAAGNFYINDKPTGAVVGQQPFGGSRASGTNDKAGSILNLLRWVSPRAIKETLVPPVDFTYPFLAED